MTSLTDKMIHNAQCAWAAKRLTDAGQPTEADEVKGIDIEHEEGHYYSEYTYEDGRFGVSVRLVNRRSAWIDAEPTEVVRECMEMLLRLG